MLSFGTNQDCIQEIPSFVIENDENCVLSGIKVFCNADEKTKIIGYLKRVITRNIKEAKEVVTYSCSYFDDDIEDLDWSFFCSFNKTDYGIYIEFYQLSLEFFGINFLEGPILVFTDFDDTAKKHNISMVGYMGYIMYSAIADAYKTFEYTYTANNDCIDEVKQLIGENFAKCLLDCMENGSLNEKLSDMSNCEELLKAIIFYAKWIDEKLIDIFPNEFKEKALEEFRKTK